MTKSVTVEFKNCYGIDALTHTFDFSNNNMPILVYAPNGVMKTSLAKTLRRYVNKKEPEDIFFPERNSTFTITDETGAALDREGVFVIDSIDEKYQSTRISVIPPFLRGLGRRIYAAILSFWAGVMPPLPMLGRSLL